MKYNIIVNYKTKNTSTPTPKKLKIKNRIRYFISGYYQVYIYDSISGSAGSAYSGRFISHPSSL